MAKPDRINSTEYYHSIKAKKVKVGDRIGFGRNMLTVVENKKNSNGNRVFQLRTNHPARAFHPTLIVDSNFEMQISRIKTKIPKKK